MNDVVKQFDCAGNMESERKDIPFLLHNSASKFRYSDGLFAKGKENRNVSLMEMVYGYI